MTLLFHKLLLLLLTVPSLFIDGTGIAAETGIPAIAALILAVVLSSLCSYFEPGHFRRTPAASRVSSCLNLLYCAIALVWSPLFSFLPLAAYDCGRQSWPWQRFLWLLPLLSGLVLTKPLLWLSCTLLCLLAVFLQRQEARYEQLLHEYHQVRDDITETALLLQEKNKELLKKQDYEVELATLAERNRIAREIHDNVGHLLTRSILQVSALQVIHGSSGELKEQLNAVKDTLTDAMDNVRQSVHNLHENSIDLKQQLTRLTEDFTFCPAKLDFDSGPLPTEMSYAVISIVKEALSNIARHSNATGVWISLVEHPSLYQLQIRDNGTLSTPQNPGRMARDGMGLSNMEDRIRALQGVFRIDRSNGFKIFITIPKQKQNAIQVR